MAREQAEEPEKISFWGGAAVVGFGKLFRLVQRLVGVRAGSRCRFAYFWNLFDSTISV